MASEKALVESHPASPPLLARPSRNSAEPITVPRLTVVVEDQVDMGTLLAEDTKVCFHISFISKR